MRASVWALLLLLPSLLLAAPPDQPNHLSFSLSFSASLRSELLQSRKPSGYVPFGEAGDPETYAKVLHIAIPQGSQIQLTLHELKGQRTGVLPRSFDGLPLAQKAFSRLYPKQAVWISPPKSFRQVQYVDVYVFPIQWELHSNQIVFRSSISFDLTFDRQPGTRIEEKDEVAKINDRFFYNEWRDKGSSVRVAAKTPSVVWQPPAHVGTVYKIKVRQNGIYNLDTAFLTANTDWTIASVDPRHLRIFNRGNEIPISVSGQSDGTLDPGDTLTFYGHALTGENDPGVWQSGDFTDENVYWLFVGTVNGLRMSTRTVTPTNTFTVPTEFTSTEHFEQNPEIVQFQTQPDTDLWLWKNAVWFDTDNSQAVQHHNVTVPSVSSNAGFQASLKFVCRSRSYDVNVNPDHHVIVKLNGSTLGDFTMNDYEVKQPVYVFNQSLLGGSGNVNIDVSHEVTDPALLGTTIDAVQSNWFELTYARQFVAYNDRLAFHSPAGSFQFEIPGFSSNSISLLDITSPDAPLMLNGGAITTAGTSKIAFEDIVSGGGNDYLATLPVVPSVSDFVADAPSSLESLNSNTAWILIAPDSWVNDSTVQNLKTLRDTQGLHAAVVSVTDIFDEYNYGIFSPYAIKDFLQSVYSSAVPANLQYVVLLGDADYDTKDYAGDGNFNLVPTYMVADPGLGSAFHPFALHSFDNYFGSFDGDSIPEVFIGRIPVRTILQAENAMNKILNYENVADHSWLGSNLLAADCQDFSGFEAQQDINAAPIPGNGASSATKMYFRLAPWNCSNKDGNGNSIADVVDEINAGQVITSWLGHGGFLQWGVPGYLASSDLSSLTNSARPTVMLNANCFTGAFYHAATSALLEDLMARPNGIVSAFGPGTYMFTFQAGPASESFYSDVYGKDKERLLGPLYQHLYMNLSADERILQGMVALGDPASRLPIPAGDAPQNLHVTAVDCAGPTIAWDPPATGTVTGYNLYRATSVSGPYTRLNGSLIATTSFADLSAASGFTYYYYVAALDSEFFETKGSNVMSFTPDPSALTITPPTLPHGLGGSPYNQLLTASGGTGPYTFSIAAGTLPTGITLASDGTISGTTSQTGTFSFTVMVSDPGACSTQQFSLTIDSPCLFCDDFEDGILAPWTYSKPLWSETSGNLVGVSTKKLTAVATPVFAGCATCTIEATMMTAGGSGNQLRLLGWYQSKSNDVELLFKEEADKIILKQRVNGNVVAKNKVAFPIVPGISYDVSMDYDGTAFHVYVNSVLMITLQKAPSTSAFGSVGFFVKATTGTFGQIEVQ